MTTIKAVFGNTPLEKPVIDVVNCVILMKVEDVQKGLDFVNQNAKVTFPRVNESMLDFGSPADDIITQSLQDTSNNTSSSIIEIVSNVVDKWQGVIRQEALVATGLLGVYLMVVLMGLIRVMRGQQDIPRNRGEGGGAFTNPRRGLAWVWAQFGSQPRLPAEPVQYYSTGPGPTPPAVLGYEYNRNQGGRL